MQIIIIWLPDNQNGMDPSYGVNKSSHWNEDYVIESNRLSILGSVKRDYLNLVSGSMCVLR